MKLMGDNAIAESYQSALEASIEKVYMTVLL